MLTAALLLSVLTPVARALPPVKTGSWDMTVMVAGQPGTSVKKVCRSQPSYNPGQSLERLEKAGMTCSRKEVTTNGAVVSMDYLCKLKDTEITSHSDTTFAGDSAFHSEVHTRYTAPSGATVSDMAMVLDGKWTGPCTDGETPE